MTIQQVEVDKIRPLRHLVLRPGQPIESTDYDRDKDEQTLHYASVSDHSVVCIATFYPEPMLEVPSLNAYRLRGMATHPNFRRQGLARDLMIKAMADITSANGDLIAPWFELISKTFLLPKWWGNLNEISQGGMKDEQIHRLEL